MCHPALFPAHAPSAPPLASRAPAAHRYLEDLQANNPAEYELLVQRMQEEARAKGEGAAGKGGGTESITVVPQPGFVAKTRSLTHGGRKVFINLCTSEHVDPCGEMAADAGDGGAPEEARVRIPLSLGPPHEDLDKDGAACTVYDCVFHPDTVQEAKKDRHFRDFMMQLVLASVQQKHGEELSAELSYPKLRSGYKGVSPLPQFMRARKGPPQPAPQPAAEGGGFEAAAHPDEGAGGAAKMIEELGGSAEERAKQQQRERLALPAPAYVLRPRDADGSLLDDATAPTGADADGADADGGAEGGGARDADDDVLRRVPAQLELKAHLPGVSAADAASDLEVEISSTEAALTVWGRFHLCLQLPHRVATEALEASFEAQRWCARPRARAPARVSASPRPRQLSPPARLPSGCPPPQRGPPQRAEPAAARAAAGGGPLGGVGGRRAAPGAEGARRGVGGAARQGGARTQGGAAA